MFWDIVLKVLKTIVLVPLALVGAVLAIPFAILLLIIGLPIEAIDHVWGKKQW